jgi:hypothetical protein
MDLYHLLQRKLYFCFHFNCAGRFAPSSVRSSPMRRVTAVASNIRRLVLTSCPAQVINTSILPGLNGFTRYKLSCYILELPVSIRTTQSCNFRLPDSFLTTTTKTPWPLVRKRTIPTGRPPLVGEFSVHFCG